MADQLLYGCYNRPDFKTWYPANGKIVNFRTDHPNCVTGTLVDDPMCSDCFRATIKTTNSSEDNQCVK